MTKRYDRLAVARACERCHQQFQPRIDQLRRGAGKYCSRTCKDAGMKRPLVERFWKKVNKTAACWIWTGHIGRAGYGIFVDGKRPNMRAWLTHRLAWELTQGEIPEGQNLCHRCDVRSCVNPAHLFLGTDAENMQDCVAKGRISRGANVHLSKLTEDNVREIRKSAQPSGALAAKFKVSRVTVNHIRAHSTWKHVKP